MTNTHLIQPLGISYVPFVAAFCGCSGSGKSTAAEKTAERFIQRGISARELNFDDYYRDQSHLEPAERDRQNYDTLETCDTRLGDRHLGELIRGKTIQKPIYHFPTHTRKPETEPFYPAQVILVPTIFAFDLRNTHYNIVTDTPTGPDFGPENLCFQRRCSRDMRQRGRTEESVREQWPDVYRMHMEYRPRIWAWGNIIFPWAHPEEENDSAADKLFEVVFAEYQRFNLMYQRGPNAWPVMPRLGFVP